MTPLPEQPDHYRQGLADAAVAIVATKRLPHHITATDIGQVLGLTHQELVLAVDRFKIRRRQGAPLGPVGGLRRSTGTVTSSAPQRPTPRRAPGPAPAGQKWCGWHATFHPLDDFGKNRGTKDGLQNYCRAGVRESQAASYDRRTGRA